MLYVCATPIGNLGDVTLRVLDALARVDLIAAEDTRRTRRLLAHFDIHTPLTSLFTHNEAQKTGQVLARLRAGGDVALVTDAGMPGVSDPGSRLVAAALADGLPVTVLPGASAPVTGLVASGLASDAGFRFVGYLPRRKADLVRAWDDWRRCGGVIVAFETPQRLSRSLATLAGLGPDTRGAVCRELTKVHEQVLRGSLSELHASFGATGAGAGSEGTTGVASATPPGKPAEEGQSRGEITLVIDVGPAARDVSAADVEGSATRLLARGLSRRDAAAALTVCLGVPHRVADEAARAAAAHDSQPAS